METTGDVSRPRGVWSDGIRSESTAELGKLRGGLTRWPVHSCAGTRPSRGPKGAPASISPVPRHLTSTVPRHPFITVPRHPFRDALLAQSAEHSHGKAGVVGSIPTEGSTKWSGRPGREQRPWQRSSVGQSIRLIIGRSSVQVRSPLQLSIHPKKSSKRK
jgi:hypothetical protein